MTIRVKRKIHSSVKKKGAVDLAAIGRRIRELRGFDMQQSEMAEILGISQSQLSKYERGESEPTLEILLRLRDRYQKSVDWILTGEE